MKSGLKINSVQCNPKRNPMASEVLYVSEQSPWGELGYETVATAFRSVYPVFWSPGSDKPDLSNWDGDWIICFKSDLIIPEPILRRAKKGAINFHPCPPRYRGVGGYWWALKNDDKTFGVTCHHMDERIDHGEIIATESFPIWPMDTVESLKHRAALNSLALLSQTLDKIVRDEPLILCRAQWEGQLYTKKMLLKAEAAEQKSGERRPKAAPRLSNDITPALASLEDIRASLLDMAD